VSFPITRLTARAGIAVDTLAEPRSDADLAHLGRCWALHRVFLEQSGDPQPKVGWCTSAWVVNLNRATARQGGRLSS
jgi:hypothetical protein